MQYLRFWIRSVAVLIPITFVLLYFGSHVSLIKALIAIAIEALIGIISVIPLLLLFSGVDRTMWGQDEYDQKIAKRREEIRLRRIASRDSETSEQDDGV